MSSNPAKPFLVPREDDPQLQLLNEKISKLAAVKPAGDVFSAFALAAHLADLAIEAARELGQMPGVDMKVLQRRELLYGMTVRIVASSSSHASHFGRQNPRTMR
jgi:hypothetical protein